MTLGDIIKNYRKNKDISMQDFADKANLSKSYISMLENNKNPSTGLPITPTLPTIKSIASAMGLSFDELFSIIDPDSEISLNDFDYSRFGLLPVEKHEIPLLGRIACGKPIFADENIETYIDPKDVEADFALRCEGDSMIDMGIEDGDIAFIRKQETLNNGDVGVIAVDDEVTLKRFVRYPDRIELHPANKKYMALIILENEHKDVRIIGKLVGFYHQVEKASANTPLK